MKTEEQKAKKRTRDLIYYRANRDRRLEEMRQHYLTNRTAARAAGREWYALNSDVVKARVREWRRANPAAHREWNAAWDLKHPEARRASRAKWLAAHPEERRSFRAARRAREMQAPGSHTVQQWQEKVLLFGGCCAYCGESSLPLERDHKIPLIRGGSHDITNIVPACRPCNARKHTRTATEFIQQLALIA